MLYIGSKNIDTLLIIYLGGIIMNEVPNIISTKDLSYIKDMLKWNFTLIKKTNMYVEMCTDESVKKLLERVSKVHKAQFEDLMDILK